MKSFESFCLKEDLIDRLEDFVGRPLKGQRMVIKGYPVYLDDKNSGNDGIEMDAVDADAAKGLARELKKAGFKVTITNNTGMLIQ